MSQKSTFLTHISRTGVKSVYDQTAFLPLRVLLIRFSKAMSRPKLFFSTKISLPISPPNSDVSLSFEEQLNRTCLLVYLPKAW